MSSAGAATGTAFFPPPFFPPGFAAAFGAEDFTGADAGEAADFTGLAVLGALAAADFGADAADLAFAADDFGADAADSGLAAEVKNRPASAARGIIRRFITELFYIIPACACVMRMG
jgi:hypothetical protein